MKNTEEFIKLKDSQKALKEDIKKRKENRPRHFIIFLLITVCLFSFLEEVMYCCYGSSFNYIIFGILLFIVIYLIYIRQGNNIIKMQKREIQKIRMKLYNLMKLETAAEDD